MGLSLLLAVVIMVLIFVVYHQKKNYRLLLAEKNKLFSLNEAKDQLSSIIAHDLRAFMTVQKINLTKLKTALSQERISEAISFTEIAETISNRTHALLNNLLYWSLNQTGQLSFKRERLRLRNIIEQVCYDFAPLAFNKKIDLKNNVSEELYIAGDLNSLKVVFRNLVDNSLKYTPANGSIIISAEEGQEECYIKVKDTGIGMDQGMIDAILTSEIRLQGSAYDKRSTGLGLWLSRNMSEKNGGKLIINSKKAEGTEITVRLPKADEE